MISFANSRGNLFNRLGSLGYVVETLKTYQNNQLTNLTDTNVGVVSQYNSESDLQAEIGSNYISILSATDGVVSSVLQQLAADTFNRVVYRDNPQLNQTLTNANTLASIQEVIRQMKVEGATVLAMVVAASPGPFVGTGNGVATASVRRPLDGLVLENSFGENVTVLCTSDSYSGTATAGNEGFQIYGAGNESDFFAFDWPLGSNCSVNVNAIDGDVSNGSGNILANSGFKNFTNNFPNNWSIVQGVAGTNFFQENSVVYTPGGALRITGDGTTQVSLQQQFGSSNGTSQTLSPQTQYSVNLFMRRDGTAANAGQMAVELVDQNGNVINDVAGNPNQFFVNLTQLTTIYAAYNLQFRTPSVLPAQTFLRFGQSVALSNGRSVYLAKCSMGNSTQLYTSGPFAAVHAGSVPFQINDYSTIVVTNSRGAGGTLSTMQTLVAQLLNQYIYSNEILFPSSSTPTLSDTSLIS